MPDIFNVQLLRAKLFCNVGSTQKAAASIQIAFKIQAVLFCLHALLIYRSFIVHIRHESSILHNFLKSSSLFFKIKITYIYIYFSLIT